jgi:hypothetical protein
MFVSFTRLLIVTRRVLLVEQELFLLPMHLSSHLCLWWCSCCSVFSFLCSICRSFCMVVYVLWFTTCITPLLSSDLSYICCCWFNYQDVEGSDPINFVWFNYQDVEGSDPINFVWFNYQDVEGSDHINFVWFNYQDVEGSDHINFVWFNYQDVEGSDHINFVWFNYQDMEGSDHINFVWFNYQDVEGSDPINRFNLATFICLSQIRIPNSEVFYSMIWSERQLFVLLTLVELLSITV